ncbi:NAD(P)-binding protein [Mycena alexandri]|uniref:NAD(P)-binding protein n=1 Tax=Mycena alexandri TaxID=1745969 RepID=A0AAD6S4Z9_9AGAR|nr:NAD(P)-binding protein [Mycena alexandri]
MVYSVVVAGASRGLGLEYVNFLSKDSNANIVIGLYRSPSSASKLLQLAKERPNVHAIQADVGKLSDIQSAVEQATRVLDGKLDLLINNAFYAGEPAKFCAPLHTRSAEELEADLHAAFQVNTVGPIMTANLFLPLLRAGPTKKIMNISTLAADTDVVLRAPLIEPVYAITKAALNMATVSMAVGGLREEAFTILAVSPGVSNTADADTPLDPQIASDIKKIYENLRAAYPDWDGVADAPEDTVRMTLDVINKATPAQSGRFVSHFGIENDRWL